jgi:glucosamine--fructose-6-phosphate aminotransferase (isomerizing)
VVVDRLLSANEALCRDLADRLAAEPPPFVVTSARGSSDNAATFAKYLLEISLGLVTASVGPSISSVYRSRLRARHALFLTISQSGRSPDLIALAEAAGEDGALTVALVNDISSPLARSCQVVLPLHAGPERSVAATKSLIAAMAAVFQLLAYWTRQDALMDAVARLPDMLAAAQRQDWTAALPPLMAARDLFVVGRGAGYAAAQEAALKLKETAGVHAEALSAAELMHGPLTLAGADFPVLLFSQQDDALPGLVELARDLAARSVPVIAAGPAAGAGAIGLPVPAGLHPFAAPIALIQSFYPLAEATARGRGRDPDRPLHLSKVTETL